MHKNLIKQNLRQSLQELASGDVIPIDQAIKEAKKEALRAPFTAPTLVVSLDFYRSPLKAK
jgi:hypothetical protein